MESNKQDILERVFNSVDNSFLFSSPRILGLIDIFSLPEATLFGRTFKPQSEKINLEKLMEGLICCTYRKEMPLLSQKVKFDSDVGWGCTLRAMQSLVFKAMVTLQKGSLLDKGSILRVYRQCLLCFLDVQIPEQLNKDLFGCEWSSVPVFSLQNLLSAAAEIQKQPGEFFTGSEAAFCFKQVSIEQKLSFKVFSYTSALEEEKLRSDLLREDENGVIQYGESTFSLENKAVVLVTLRLDEMLTETSFEAVKYYLGRRNCEGFVGGMKNEAFFFLGFSGDNLIYLDPHLAQKAPVVNDFYRHRFADYEPKFTYMTHFSKVSGYLTFCFSLTSDLDYLILRNTKALLAKNRIVVEDSELSISNDF